jgi:RecA-family ATPase
MEAQLSDPASYGAPAFANGIADRLAINLPRPLTSPERKQFLLWRYEPNPNGKKPRKVPYYVNGQRRNGTQGAPEDRSKLATFSEALKRLEAGGYSGIGIAMLPGGGLVGVDLDNCLSEGEISPGLKPFIQDTYAEISPSGNGVRAFYLGEYSDRKHHEIGVETFCRQGFLTVTGDRLNTDDIAPLPACVRARLDRVFSSQRGKSNRTDRLRELKEQDTVYQHLRDHGLIKKDFGDGRIGIACPFEEEHTTGDGDSDCAYFLPHTNGYATGNFCCFHAHCANRTQADFRRATGVVDGVQDNAENVPTRDALAISHDEWMGSKLTPRCIVKDYLYADVAVFVAPGGTGKTTLALYEAIHILLGRRLYGLDVVNPGWVLFITAEDSRERLVARLREIATAMDLKPDELDKVRRGALCWDVSGGSLKLITLSDGNIQLAPVLDEIIATHKNDPPALVTFDPIVSFGVGESRVNDNEQGLIDAARRLRNGLGCAVRVIHHTGKANARDKTLDQYTARGGSALPDGSRMSFVLQSWTPNQSQTPPDGCQPDSDSSITILARPKLSYARPNLPLIWIKRTGWAFEHHTEIAVSAEERDRAILNQVVQFLKSAEKRGAYYTKTDLESAHKEMRLQRNVIRDARDRLMAEGRIIEKDLPKELQKTKRKTYLSLRQDSAGFHEGTENQWGDPAEKTPKINPAALRENIGGRIKPPNIPPSPNAAGVTRQDSAGLAGLDENNTGSDRWKVEI